MKEYIYRLPKLQPGTFLTRLNRFGVMINYEGKPVYLHLPNSGRMKELLVQGKKILWKPRENKGKTQGTLWAVFHENRWVMLVAVMANDLFESGLNQNIFKDFNYCQIEKREAKKGKSRFDFLLTNQKNQKKRWVEVKSVNLSVNQVGLFPDAPTTRGKRHLDELAELVLQGDEASVVFLGLREDINSFSPHKEMDLDFASSLEKAVKIGVSCFAFASFWDETGCFNLKKIQVKI